MKVTLIRHGQSTYNSGENICLNSPLTKLGIEQSRGITGSYDLIITSNLLRSHQTLEYSNLRYKEMISVPLCRELMRGHLCDYLVGEDLDIYESDKDIKDRVDKFKELLSSKGDLKILVISHGLFICALTGTKDMIDNCKMVSLDITSFNHFRS